MKIPSIIVANDDPVYLEMIKELLIEEGYPDVACIQGPAAFSLIVEQLPNLILLDINYSDPGEGWKPNAERKGRVAARNALRDTGEAL